MADVSKLFGQVYITKELLADDTAFIEEFTSFLAGTLCLRRVRPISPTHSAVEFEYSADGRFGPFCDRCHGEHHEDGDELQEYDGVAMGGGGEYCHYCLGEFRMEE